MASNLKLQNGAMVGTLAGKPLFCFLRATQGSALPAGEYIVRGPVEDPIYGPVAILVSKGSHSGGTVAIEWTYRAHDWIQQPPAGAAAADAWSPAMAGTATGYFQCAPGGSGGAFLVSGRSIPGQNCLVVTSGLSELMDALKAAGSASITVG